MKRNAMLQFLFFIIFILGYTVASAQDYLVTLKRDTLWGKVRYFNSAAKYGGNGGKYVQLTPENGKKSTHAVLQTLSFKIDDDVYHTIKFAEGYTFMKLISAGYLSLYSFQLENQTTWDGRYLVKKDGALMEVPNIGFKKRVIEFLADCPDVVQKIESGVFGKPDLINIISAYNACIELNNSPRHIEKSPSSVTWANLESAVIALPIFDKKNDALEMIREIQSKVAKNESIPSFLINGLKDSLKDQSSVKETLDLALEKLN